MRKIFQIQVIAILLLWILPASLVFGQDHAYTPGQLYVRLKEPYANNITYKPSDKVMEVFRPYRVTYKISKVQASFYFSASEELRRTFRVYFDPSVNSAQLIRALVANPAVEYAEKIPQDRFFYTPNDLGSNSSSGTGQWYLYKIRAQQAWDKQRGGRASVKVAVIDDAVQTNHPELEGICLPGRDVAQNIDSPEPPSEAFSHGTHVAGIIGAKTNNGIGIASLAHGVSIIPVKITLNGQPGAPSAGYEGIAWAVSKGADIINISWGSESVSFTAQSVVTNALNAGVIVIAAAGNSGTPAVNYPAGYTGVISVASTTSTDAKAGSSNYGGWIDIAAPGDKIRSIIPFNNYGFKSGTSFAAPLVSALAALILSNDSTLSPSDVEKCILGSADNIDAFNSTLIGQLGAGRINAEKAISCAAARKATCEVGILKVTSPEVTSCNSNFSPGFQVINYGTDTVFSFTVNYQLDNQFPRLFTFKGKIHPGKDSIITLPEMQASIGDHTLRFTVLNSLNGNCPDAYPGNNQISYKFNVLNQLGFALPFTENFESNTFLTNGWTVINPGSAFGWEIAPTAGLTPGSKSARLSYYLDTQKGERDYLITPALNFSGYSAISLSFRHAYASRGILFPSDTFIVSISTDCGISWKRLKVFAETGSKTFSTRIANGLFFSPTVASDWCGATGWAACSTINLNAYLGFTGVRIRFEGFNNTGNNIFLDNISITGTAANLKPDARFSATGNEQVCEGKSIQFTNQSLNQPTFLKWYFEGGSPDSSDLQQPIVSYSTAGNYTVKLIAGNSAGRDTLIKEAFIKVNPSPQITVTANPDSICRGSTSKLIATGGASYAWNQHPSLNTLIKDTVIASPTTTTTYTVQILTAEGCTGSGTVKLFVYPLPPQPVISVETDSCLLIATKGSAYEWFYNGLVIEGFNEQQLQAIRPGNYNVRVFNEKGCAAFSPPFKTSCNTTGISEINTPLIYPNPFSEQLIIEDIGSKTFIGLYNLAGAMVKTNFSFQNERMVLSTGNLPAGIYLLRINNERGERHLKLVKTE